MPEAYSTASGARDDSAPIVPERVRLMVAGVPRGGQTLIINFWSSRHTRFGAAGGFHRHITQPRRPERNQQPGRLDVRGER